MRGSARRVAVFLATVPLLVMLLPGIGEATARALAAQARARRGAPLAGGSGGSRRQLLCG